MRCTEQRTWYSTIAAAAALGLAVSVAACGSSTPEPAAEETAPASAPTVPRVYFVEPRDGATVTSPVHFMFGSDQTGDFTISPVPQGELTDADVRPGMGHYHLGLAGECLPPGERIPQGNPAWVHFGQGNNMIDMPLAPGTHRLVVQAGDDLHRALPGLCETITITVTE